MKVLTLAVMNLVYLLPDI